MYFEYGENEILYLKSKDRKLAEVIEKIGLILNRKQQKRRKNEMANIIVLFEVTPTKEGMQKYLDLAAMLKPMLAGFEGFIRAERFSSLNEEGKLLSMNIWTDEAAVERWRNVMQHRMSQKEGREKLFESYKITVCSEIRSYTDKDRSQAPQDSNAFFEV